MATELRLAREAKGIRQQKMARDLGISQSLLSYLEQGARRPTLEIAVKVAAYLGLGVQHLFPDLWERRPHRH